MFRYVLFRCLPALVILAVIPAAPQNQLLSDSNPASSDTVAATENSGDIPSGDEQLSTSQLSPQDMGELHMVRHRYQAAIESFSLIKDRSAQVWNEMGIAYQQMFALKEAEKCYKEALKLDPENPTYLNNMGTIQDSLQNFGAAESIYRKALKINPNSAVLYKNLGTNLLMQHEYEKGDEAYNKALAIDPKIFDIRRTAPKVNDPAPQSEHGTAAYFKARNCARAGLQDCAIEFLIKAFNEGYATVDKVNKESDFSSLQGTPAMTRLLARQR